MTKCLIVDDVEVTRFSSKTFLANAGVDVVAVGTIQDAENALSASRFDCIFVDWHLGKDSGLTFIQNLRKQGDKTPIAVISGVEQQEKASEALKAGANKFITKPTTKDNLVSCMADMGIHVG